MKSTKRKSVAINVAKGRTAQFVRYVFVELDRIKVHEFVRLLRLNNKYF